MKETMSAAEWERAKAAERFAELDSLLDKIEGDSEYGVLRPLTKQADNLKYGRYMRQFVVYNPTAAIVYIHLGGEQPDATRYTITVAANRMFVSPGVGFNELTYTLSAAPGLVNAFIVAYEDDRYSPSQVSI